MLIIWDKSEEEFLKFFNLINNLRPNQICFTYEKENNNLLSFLDLLLIRGNNNIEYEIYRKELSVNRYLNFKSHHMFSAKLAVMDSQIKRALILDKSKQQLELEKVRHHLNLNEYPVNLINKRIDYHLRGDNKDKNIKSDKTFVNIPYIKGVSEKIAKTFKEYDGFVSYHRIRNDLYKRFYNNKDKIANDLKSGIYLIECKDCDKKYYGETKRQFIVRLNEHRLATRNLKTNVSNVAEHSVIEKHEIDWNNSKIIKCVSNDFSRKFLESIAIRTSDESQRINKNSGEFMPYYWNRLIRPLNTARD